MSVTEPVSNHPTSPSSKARSHYKQEIPQPLCTQLKSLEQKSNWINVLYLAGDWATILLVSFVTVKVGMSFVVYLFAALIIASRQRALMNLVHEASHYKLFANVLANDAICKVFAAYPLGTGLSSYRADHRDHHAYLWSEQKDSKTQKYIRLGIFPPPMTFQQFFLALVSKQMLLHLIRTWLSFLLQQNEDRSETYLRIGFWIIVVICLLICHAWIYFLLFWILPYSSFYLIIHFFNELADHVGLQTEDAWQATRNWNSFILTRYLLAPHSDDLYHLTHHLFPLIPHYHLAKAHRLLMDQVPQYAQAHHCEGFFFPRRQGRPSVLQDILRPK